MITGNLDASSCGENIGDMQFYYPYSETIMSNFVATTYTDTHILLVTRNGGQCRTKSISSNTYQRPALYY